MGAEGYLTDVDQSVNLLNITGFQDLQKRVEVLHEYAIWPVLINFGTC